MLTGTSTLEGDRVQGAGLRRVRKLANAKTQEEQNLWKKRVESLFITQIDA